MPSRSASAASVENASTNGPPKSVAYFSSPVRVAVTTTRPGPGQRLDERAARARGVHEHHALRLAAAPAAARNPAASCRARQVELRDVRRERAVAEEDDRRRCRPAPAFAASASSALRHRVRSSPPASASSVTFALSTPSFCDAVSASVVPHFLNSSPCSGVAGEPDDDQQMRRLARTHGRHASSSGEQAMQHAPRRASASRPSREPPHAAGGPTRRTSSRRAPSAGSACARARALRPR